MKKLFAFSTVLPPKNAVPGQDLVVPLPLVRSPVFKSYQWWYTIASILGRRLNLLHKSAFTPTMQLLWASVIESPPTSKLPRFSIQIPLAFAPLIPAGILSKDRHSATVPSGNVVR